MELNLIFRPGCALATPPGQGGWEDGLVVEGDIQTLAKAVSRQFQALLHPGEVHKPRGARGFSFHWSNAQAKWDVIPANDPSWSVDGAEFVLYFVPGALSPLDRPWTGTEMKYMAKALPPHPGYSVGMRAAALVARIHREGGL